MVILRIKRSFCTSCGARIPRLRKRCNKCGTSIAHKVTRKVYSGVRQQQGRVATDGDWGEVARIGGRKAQKIAAVRCASCGAINTTKSAHCKNCGANL